MNYRFAAEECKKNATGHARTAYLLKSRAGTSGDLTLGYAMSHACFAFEEGCKAAWCAMVARGAFPAWAFKQEIHRWHHAKTFLFVALTGAKVIRGPSQGSFRVLDADLTPERLKKIKREGTKPTRRFEKDRQSGLYVDLRRHSLRTPLDVPPAKAEHLIYRYAHRMAAMLTVCDRVLGLKPEEYITGISVTELNGAWKISLN